MKVRIHYVVLFAISLFFLCSIVVKAQTVGDFRSAVNGGVWSSASTWETFNGTSWVAATTPPSAANNVAIRSGFNVILDASGKNCLNLTVESGATFTSGIALPTSTIRYVRINGTTATIDGTFGNAIAPGDAISLENANNGGTITITGSGTFAPARVRVNSNASGTTTVFDIDATFMYTGSSGTGGMGLYPQTDSNTVVVNAGNALTFSDYSSIGVGSSSGTSAPYTFTLIVNGTVDLSKPNCSATLKVPNGKTATLVIGPTGSMTVGKHLHLSTLTDSGTTVVVDSGALAVGGTVDLSHPTFSMTGPGTFTLAPGGGLLIGSPFGLDPASGPIRTQTRNLPEQATYTFNNQISNQFTGTDLPDRIYALVINNANDTVMLSKKIRVGHLTVNQNGALKVTDSLQIDTSGNISGTLANAGTITAADTLAFLPGSRYKHERNGGSVPTATWDSNATCLFTGLSSTAPGNANQNFHHVVWDCPLQNGNLTLAWNGNTIRGDITVVNTGSRRWDLCDPPAGTAGSRTKAEVTVNGNIIQTGGEFSSNGSNNGYTDITIHSKGNVTVTGGNFSVSRGNQGNTGTTEWRLYGDITMSNATTQNSNADGAAFVFAGAAVRKLTMGAGNTITAFPLRLQHGAVLDLDTSVIFGAGNLSIDSGATIMTKHAKGLDGNIKSTGKRTLSTYANFEFKGSETQTTGTILPDTVNGFTVENAYGVTLSKSHTLRNALKLASGKLSIGQYGLTVDSIAGGSASSYIVTKDTGSLKIRNIGDSSEVLFPIGTDSYTPLRLRNKGTSDHFTVRVQNTITNMPNDSGKAVRRQWRITEEVQGGTQAQLSLEWNGADEAGLFQRTDTVVVGKFDGQKWTERLGVMSGTGPYRMTVDSIDSFSDWAIGNIGAFSDEGITGYTENNISVPRVMTLSQNFPNPFNPVTKISFSVGKTGVAHIHVFNLLGQMIARLYNGEAISGRTYDVTFDGRHSASGMYLYVLESNGQRIIKRMVLIK